MYARETLGTTIMDPTTHDRVPYHFSRTDERCFFTFAHYVEPMTSIVVTIYDLQNAISARIHHTWGIRIPTLTFYSFGTRKSRAIIIDLIQNFRSIRF